MYLNCKTYFSYRYGTFTTEELVKAGAAIGAEALALTNINCTADAWDFYEFCIQQGIRPVLGAEVRNEDTFCYLLLAKNLDGFAAINRFLSEHLQTKAPFPQRPRLKAEHVRIIYGMETAAPGALRPGDLDEHELIGVRPSEVNKLYGKNTTGGKFVIRNPVSFQAPPADDNSRDRNQKNESYRLHRLLRAIDKNTLLTRQQPEDIAAADEFFHTQEQLTAVFAHHPTLITRTKEVMDTCDLSLDFSTDKTLQTYTGSKKEDRKLLRQKALEGFRYRYEARADALERVEKELGIIDQMGFNAFFLITWDVIRYAQSRGFYYVGRGSGANSIVAYCLQITDVDPMELNLYFERFLNPKRSSPPDFDIDFSWKDRDEVMQYVFTKYGSERVALLGMFSTFQRNATIRELGKVCGLPKPEIDALVDSPKAPLKEDRYQRGIQHYSERMINFPNHGSVHPGGMLISEKPMYTYTVVELPPKGLPAAQIDLFLAEKINLFKLDLLSQRGLGHIKDCIELVRQNKGVSIDIHDVETFKHDPLVAARIRKADSIGCFYIESPGMRQLLQKLRCDDYLTLVAASSIIRPGVAQSGMMRQYIHRFHHPAAIEYLHPKLEELLKETFGVMVYQEDVIKVAHYFAGLDLGEADVLRRAMSGKYRGNDRFRAIRDRFFEGCKAKGYEEALSAEVWRQMESFAGFSFSKAHSASFAVESYQSLYLKTYYPMEFMVAVINNFGGFYRTEVYFHELKGTGATVLPPCVNEGSYETSIKGSTVITGFNHVQGLEEKLVKTLLAERAHNGIFTDVGDLVDRVAITPEQMNLLIRIGALRFTGKRKKELLWEATFLYKKKQRQPAGVALFREQPARWQLPDLAEHPLDDAYDEMELLGFPLTNVWALADVDLEAFKTTSDLPACLGQTVTMIGYLVITKQARTQKGESMMFGTFFDKRGDWVDTVHFPASLARFPFQGNGFYVFTGKVIEEFGVYSVDVNAMRKQGLKGRSIL
ncbi:DNA polymerase III subunit alpha [Dinghuibacter silviterrae]|uniref:DNA-directed DNA polymerase n=1 Tax=Dinghuibacter silviterrae TaxID=1539049 RepID=A0A4R8DHC5_9BACT|nr:DNA polymerase III subunit alpha [Dinghuibacter silviterrae]TDW96828.1 DNA polymerase-3 subunit alpha [Dinghuibacter silviterrae]